jgi:chitin synthase
MLDLDDPSSYALLASSGTYLLPGGPLSDDHAQMGELRAAMALLGFKSKHVASIFSLLTAILLLGNLEFSDNGAYDLSDESATVKNPLVLNEIASLLGVSAESLESSLTNKTKYIRREVASGFLNAAGAEVQRDSLVRDLYAILFAWVVESANQKLTPEEPSITHITLFDQPGMQSRTPTGSPGSPVQAPLITANGQNGFEELCTNFSAELLHSFFVRRTFDDSTSYNGAITSDRVPLPSVLTMDNAGCVELLRGGPLGSRSDRKPGGLLGAMAKGVSRFKQGKSSEDKDDELLDDLTHKFGAHASFVTSPGAGMGPAVERTLFGVNHYTSSISYDVRDFIEKDMDVLDSSLVSLLRASSEPFVQKLFSGPSIAVEVHPQDAQTIVQAQVSVLPFRDPSPASPSSPPFQRSIEQGDIYSVTTQLNATLSDLFLSLEQSRTWDVLCIRPNDNSIPNSFDKRRVKSQIRSFLLPDLVKRRQTDYVADFELNDFVSRYGLPPSDSDPASSIGSYVSSRGWTEGLDYAIGERSVWLSYDAWKEVEDQVRDDEKRRGDPAAAEDVDDSTTNHGDDLAVPSTPWNAGDAGESSDNLLLRRTNTTGTGYYEPNGYGSGSNVPASPGAHTGALPAHAREEYAASWVEPEAWKENQSIHDTERGFTGPGLDGLTPLHKGEGTDGLVVKEKGTVETIPIEGARKWWVRFVWVLTGIIPSSALSGMGGMKRPDVRLAWREKLAICMLIFFLCGVVIFYVVVFGKLLCPDFDKAWNTNEVGEHAQSNTFYVAVHGSSSPCLVHFVEL